MGETSAVPDAMAADRHRAALVPERWVNPLTGVATALASLALYIWRPEHVTSVHSVFVIVCLWVTVGGCLWWYANRVESVLPLFPVSLVIYFISFPLALYFHGYIWPPDVIPIFLGYYADDFQEFGTVKAVGLVLVGMVMYTSAFILFRRHVAHRLPHFRLPRQYSNSRLRLLCWTLIVAHLAYVGVPAIQQIPSIGQFLIPAGFVGISVLFYLWSQGVVSNLEAVAALVALITGLAMRVLINWGLTPIVLFGLTFFFVYYFIYRRIPVITLTMVVVTLFMSYGGVQLYRHLKTTDTWHERSTSLGIVSDAINVGRLTYFLWVEPTGENWKDLNRLGFRYIRSNNFGPILKRITLLPLMSYVAERSPDDVPYWRGETYRGLLVNVIPRVLWPGKPEETWGNAMGQRYRILALSDRVTSVNIPWLVELFINFGVLGVLLGMFGIGVFMAAIDRIFNAGGMTPLEALSGIAIVVPLVYHESNFTVMTGSLIPLMACIFLYFRVGLTFGRQ